MVWHFRVLGLLSELLRVEEYVWVWGIMLMEA